MIILLNAIILASIISTILSSPFVTVYATQSNSKDLSVSSGFGGDLKSRIQDLVSDALNDTENGINSSTLLRNLSNLSSSNLITSKSIITSSVNSNSSDSSSSSLVKNQIKTVNGECTSIKVGGNGNDTLTSYGNCNDEFTGGSGADKFTCGEGNDTIKDYNSNEGDTISDQENCEKIL
jgi:hypothetical protein